MKYLTQEDIFKKYPKIFRQKDLPMTETAMCWGLQCGKGWYKLINDLCFFIQFNVDHNKMPQVDFSTVKEKYGSLTIYTNEANEYLEGAIAFACMMSDRICENCGSIDDIKKTQGYYVNTLCGKCRKEIK